VPPVAGVALALLVREVAADERHLTQRRTLDPRPDVEILLRQPLLPHVGRLHHVVVYRDDLRDVGHGLSPWSPPV
jgi:hypothetical protein